MVGKKAKGKRSKTRAKLKGKPGKPTVNRLLSSFDDGALVQINIRPDIHAGMPAAIYQGCFGVIEKKQGKSYRVSVKKGKAQKTVLVNGIHLKMQGAGA